MRQILTALALTALASGLALGQVQLVKDGEAVSDIVCAKGANQSMKLAAKDLQEFLEKISGAELLIVESPSADVPNHVYAGVSEFTKALGFTPADFQTSGYEIVSKDNYVILSGADRLSKPTPFGPRGEKLKAWQDFCGEKFTTAQLDFGGAGRRNNELNLFKNDDTGTWYAASALLEQLGVRFYAPYEDGTVIPQMKDVAIKEQHVKREAAFRKREWHYYLSLADNTRWLKRMKCGNFVTIILNHTTTAIYASEEQHKLHPEYLACDADGKPYERAYGGTPPNSGGVPRYTNPDFRRASVVLMNRLFEASPELYAISLGPPDGAVQVDARDIDLYGKPGDTREQKASNYVWDYHVFLAKELQKSHPDKFLFYSSGGGAGEIPTNRKPDDPHNIIKHFAQPYSAYRVLDYVDKGVVARRKKWLDVLRPSGKAPIWDYFLYYRFQTHPRFPVFFTKHLQYEMQEMLPYSDGKFIEVNFASQSSGLRGEAGARFGEAAITHLMMYWQNKLLWDPYAGRDAMLEEYYRLYFGPAAAEMKEFHEFAEAVWCRQGSRSVTAHTGFLKQADIDKYFEILSRARAKAVKDTVYDRRIAKMESAYSPLKHFFADLQRRGPWVRAYVAPGDVKVDGDVSEFKEGWKDLCQTPTDHPPEKNRARVCLTLSEDRKNLYVAAVCDEDEMGKLKADTKFDDVPAIFDDDVIEVYINTPERSFFKIVVNPNAAIWDESQDVTIIDRDTQPLLWNPGTQAVVKKFADRWQVEIMIPTEDLGKTGPTKENPWGIQVGRTRFTGGKTPSCRLGPGSGRYDTQNQWGNLWME